MVPWGESLGQGIWLQGEEAQMVMRRVLPILVAGSVAATGAVVPSASGQEAPPEVPEVVQIEDPAGDANYLNDQGLAPFGVPDEGDRTTPVSLSVSDILKVWFTHDADNISVHVQTSAPPPATNSSYIYRVFFNPGDNPAGCLWFEIITEGPTWAGGEFFGRLRWVCADQDPVDGEVSTVEGPDGTGITTLTVPRSLDPAFEDDAVLAAPSAETRNNSGTPAVGRITFPVVDDTKVGTEYEITAEEPKKPKKKKKKRNKKKRAAARPAAPATGGRMLVL